MNSPLLELQRVTVAFGQLKAVDAVSLTLGTEPVVSIIGPNGAGKTTLANAVTGVCPVTAGRIRFDDQDLVGLPPHRIAACGIARTFQNIRLFRHMTVLENVITGGQMEIGRYGLADALLATPRFRAGEEELRRQAAATLHRFGLGDKLEWHATSLSYGQQRLLELARAAIRRPRLMLLDEPAAGLTPREVAELGTYLDSLVSEGVTIVLIEHNMDLVMSVSRRIVVLSGGVIIADGTPQAVQADPAVIAAYFGTEVVADA